MEKGGQAGHLCGMDGIFFDGIGMVTRLTLSNLAEEIWFACCVFLFLLETGCNVGHENSWEHMTKLPGQTIREQHDSPHTSGV